jgi:hypothetical protein
LGKLHLIVRILIVKITNIIDGCVLGFCLTLLNHQRKKLNGGKIKMINK